MKCNCCGQETRARVATPGNSPDILEDDVSMATFCDWCDQIIYQFDEDSDWLHLGTDARRCDAED